MAAAAEFGQFSLRPMEAGRILVAAIQRFYTHNILVDVRITSHNSTVLSCHKTVLATFSTYFESLLIGTDGPAILSLDSVSAEHTKQLSNLIRFMYGYTIQVNSSDSRVLLEAANLFGVNALIKTLQAQLTKTDANVHTNSILTLKSNGIGPLLLVTFQRFKKEGKFIDAKINTGPEEFLSCHKIILASFSSYFESLLLKTEACAVMDLEAVDPLYVRQLEYIMDYMYGKSVKLNDRQVDTLSEAAKVFGIHSLESGELQRIKAKAQKYRQNQLLHRAAKKGTIKAANINKPRIAKPDLKKEEMLRKAWAMTREGESGQAASIAKPSSNKMTVKILKITSDQASEQASEPMRPTMDVMHSYASTNTLANVDQPPPQDFMQTPTSSVPNLVALGQTADQTPPSSGPNFAQSGPPILVRSGPNSEQADARISGSMAPNLTPRATFYSHQTEQSGFATNLGDTDVSSQSVDYHCLVPSSSLNLLDEHTTYDMPFLDALCNFDVQCSSSLLASTSAGSFSASSLTSYPSANPSPPPNMIFTSPLTSPPMSPLYSQDMTQDKIPYMVANTTNVKTANEETNADKSVNDGRFGSNLEVLQGNGEKSERSREPKGKNKRKVSNEPKYMCRSCGNLFRTKRSLTAHELKQHPVENDTESIATDDVADNCVEIEAESSDFLIASVSKESKSGTNPVRSVSKCPHCDFQCKEMSKLYSHVVKEHATHSTDNHVCEYCLLTFSTRNKLMKHYQTVHKMKLFKCANCTKQFSSVAGLRNHMQLHSEENFQCHFCDYKATTKQNLRYHEASHHSFSTSRNKANKLFKCSKCVKVFPYKSLLERHFTAKHAKVRPYKCPECDHRSTEKAALMTHIRCVHTQEAIYKCYSCEKSFKTSSLLWRHRRQEHETDTELSHPHKCEKCGVRYLDKRDLDVHITRDHKRLKPFVCSICFEAFFRKDHLLKHTYTIHAQNFVD